MRIDECKNQKELAEAITYKLNNPPTTSEEVDPAQMIPQELQGGDDTEPGGRNYYTDLSKEIKPVNLKAFYQELLIYARNKLLDLGIELPTTPHTDSRMALQDIVGICQKESRGQDEKKKPGPKEISPCFVKAESSYSEAVADAKKNNIHFTKGPKEAYYYYKENLQTEDYPLPKYTTWASHRRSYARQKAINTQYLDGAKATRA